VDSHTEGLADVVNALTAELTTDDLTELNRQFDIEHEDADVIAEDWLAEHEISVG
jgi:osmoprotectant transport system substrate-binding protein